MPSRQSSYVPITEAKWWSRTPARWPGRGFGAAGEEPARLWRPDRSSRRPAPGPTAREAAGVAPAATRARSRDWRRRPRDREQGRHYGPPLPAPRPQAALEARLGARKKGRGRGSEPGPGGNREAGGAGGAE